MFSYCDLLDESAVQAAVPTSVLKHAEAAAARAAEELDLAVPRLVWFTEAPAKSPGAYSRAFAMKGESRALSKTNLWLHVALRGDDLVNTVAHECRHIWQYRKGALGQFVWDNSTDDNAIAEADARSWAAVFVAKFSGAPIPEKALDESPARLLKDLRAALSSL